MATSTQTSKYDDPVVDQQARNLTKAIFQHESGMDYNAVGDNGTSHGAGQWQDATWAAQAKDVLGDANAPKTKDNQSIVAQGTIRKLISQGKNAAQIAAIWNSGSDKGWEDKVGTTTIKGKEIPYNVPKYVKSVTDLYQKYKGEAPTGGGTGAGAGTVAGLSTNSAPQGFLTNVGNDLSSRTKDLGNAVADSFSGKINPLSGVIQGAGALAGGVSDIVTEGAKGLYNGLVPDAIRNPINQAVGGVAGAIGATPAAQSAGQGIAQFQQDHPELSKDISSAFDIASVFPMFKGAQLAARATEEAIPAATRAIAATNGIAGDIAKKRLVSEALEVVSPKETAAVVKKGLKAGRGTSGGFSGTVGLEADAKTIKAAEAAAGIVRKGWTVDKNANAVLDEIGNTANQLKSELKNMDVTPIVSQDELHGVMQNAMKLIGENPTMVGDAEESARRILTKFKEFLPKEQDITASDILDARKKLDSWMGSQTGGGTVFNPAYENAKSIALRAIRQEANRLVASKAPGVSVKEMLARQSSLYDALDNLTAKGAKEVGTSRWNRFGQRHPTIKGLVKLGATSAATGLGFTEAQHFLGE